MANTGLLVIASIFIIIGLFAIGYGLFHALKPKDDADESPDDESPDEEPEDETEDESPECNLTCENDGLLNEIACNCECVGDYVGETCDKIKINSPTFFANANTCKSTPGKFWNGYECEDVATSATSCGCTVPGGGVPKCVKGQDGSREEGPGWWYVNVGGTNLKWEQGTDAKCCTARERGNFKVGDPTAWGQAPCRSAETKEACERMLTNIGCSYE